MSDIQTLMSRTRTFAKARDWERFHTTKNLVMALSVEASELVELFQWLTETEANDLASTANGRQAIEDEIADVLIYLLRLADVLAIDVAAAVNAKLDRNETRFPPGPSHTHGT